MTEETTPISNSKREIPVIEDDAFSYEGYQIVRGEFFAHTYEPSFTFNANKVSVNTACIKKLPDTDYVQILVNSEEKKLAVRPCLAVAEHQRMASFSSSRHGLTARFL